MRARTHAPLSFFLILFALLEVGGFGGGGFGGLDGFKLDDEGLRPETDTSAHSLCPSSGSCSSRLIDYYCSWSNDDDDAESCPFFRTWVHNADRTHNLMGR